MKKISYFMALNVMISRPYCSMKRKVKFYKVYALCPAGEDERDGLSMWVLSYSGKRRAGSENPEASEISFLQEWVTNNVVETNWKNFMFLREMLIPVLSQETK